MRASFVTAAAALLAVGGWLAVRGGSSLPAVGWLEANPLAAVALMVGAGFLDGLNPCAIATLLLFVGALLSAVVATARPDGSLDRGRMWRVGGAYVAGIFLLYLALGLGLLGVAEVRAFGNAHLFTRLAGLLAVGLGLMMVAETLFPDMPVRLAMPRAFHGAVRRWGRGTTVGAALVAGVLIGLCTVPCGGAMYLAIAGLLAGIQNGAYAYALLVTYDAAFVSPLVLIIALVGSRPVAQRIGRLQLTHRGAVKVALGVSVILVGFLALA